jgi:ferrous iron transport protein B
VPSDAPAAQTAFPSSEVWRRVAVIGNPNCGKTSLFNALTGLRQKVGNYPGVTVEKKEGTFYGSHGELMRLLDLPGCYSLQARSPDEAIARDVLFGRVPGETIPDVAVIVLDASNLDRNLYLLSQVLELGIPSVVVLNMIDASEKAGLRVDREKLELLLGVPVLTTVANRNTGIIALRQALSRAILPRPSLRVPLPAAFENATARTAPRLNLPSGIARAQALLLLSATPNLLAEQLRSEPELKALVEAEQNALAATGIDVNAAVAKARYDWIQITIASSVSGTRSTQPTLSDQLDAVLTHRLWGWPVFFAAMSAMFFCIFTIAQWPMDLIESAQKTFADLLSQALPDSDLRSLLIDGILSGVGGVVVFLPQILILTFFLGLLEDSGYMARAAFLMDRIMSKVGLHGKSFIPLMSSFACAIPGIMATRTVENRKDRLVTILIAPFMSCSARLPVYSLMIALLLPESSAWKKSAIILSMYALGVIVAFALAWIFKRTLLRSETPMLLLEMPPYRVPALRDVLLRMFDRAKVFLQRAGTVILALSILIWTATTYPKAPEDAPKSDALAHSVAGRLGKAIEPAIQPLGFDWKIGIGLVSSLAAREVFVGTMAIVYNVENADDNTELLVTDMRKETHPNGDPVYTPLVCVGLMVFYVLAMQCISTLAIVRRETNAWSWPAFQFVYMTAFAYAGAWLVQLIGKSLGFH